jgi:hypothetical protein
MTLVRRPSPFSELMTLRQAMDRLFDDTVFRPLTAYPGNGIQPVTTAEAKADEAGAAGGHQHPVEG